MKKILSLKVKIFLLMMMTSYCMAGEMTGAGFVRNIMAKQNLSLDSFLNTGHTLLFGEVTGAGREIQVGEIKVIITSGEAFQMDNVQNIRFRGNGGLNLSNIEAFEINQKIIYKNEIQAMVVK